MSSKRPRGFQKRKQEKDGSKMPANPSPTLILFKGYQIELDAKYDKYERLLKKSRDLTIESKRIIFLLHRVDGSETDKENLKEAKERLITLLKTTINDIGLELTQQEVHQYIKAFTNGLQEFVEAISFYYYLKKGTLMSLKELYKPDFLLDSTETSSENEPTKKSELPLSAFLTPVEYVLGIADLTGELMRKCINSVASGNLEEPFKLSLLLQNIYQELLLCSNYNKDLKRKLVTLKSSLLKVENACYAIKIRGSEIPRHMLATFFSTQEEFKDNESETVSKTSKFQESESNV